MQKCVKAMRDWPLKHAYELQGVGVLRLRLSFAGAKLNPRSA